MLQALFWQTDMKTIITWIIIVVGEFLGIYLIYAGFKRNRSDGPPFKIKHLFQTSPLYKQSGIQFIIEGVISILSGVLLYLVFLKTW
jgi:hypothetical protein